MNMISGDPLFKVAPPADEDCASSTAKGSHSQPLSSLPSCDLPSPEGDEPPMLPECPTTAPVSVAGGGCAECLQHTHSRNSSNTRQVMAAQCRLRRLTPGRARKETPPPTPSITIASTWSARPQRPPRCTCPAAAATPPPN
ncbi:unnamed protein product [Leptidea sinapis]|uniref:Uncharacterized protein n=1 Tax=Leptidea sinapis TaxID=189913 RepID=A0A5E4PNU6_9NEOP|nr:unnamed protein product [Leptidea sinapis]